MFCDNRRNKPVISQSRVATAMTLFLNVESVTSTILLALINLNLVQNMEDHFYHLLDAKRRLGSFKKGHLRNPQILIDTIHEDGIAHSEINELNPKFNEIKTIEEAFKNIVAMNGVKHIYKRKFYWRTWREVKNSEGNTSLVCYKCQNIINVTCTSCNCGYWEIEENPPCPFEILSVINNTNICVAYYNQLKILNASCPSIVSFADLVLCDNPIESIWHVNLQHDAMNISERYTNVICKERENCDFLTLYSVYPDHVTFRIINSANYIIYSKIMKNDNKNYACSSNCGVFKPMPATQTKDRKNLYNLKLKNRLDGGFNNRDKKDKSTKIKLNELLKVHRKSFHFHNEGTKPSPLHCQQLQKTHSEEYDESEYNDY